MDLCNECQSLDGLEFGRSLLCASYHHLIKNALIKDYNYSPCNGKRCQSWQIKQSFLFMFENDEFLYCSLFPSIRKDYLRVFRAKVITNNYVEDKHFTI